MRPHPYILTLLVFLLVGASSALGDSPESLPRVDRLSSAVSTNIGPEPHENEVRIVLPESVPELPISEIIFHAKETLGQKDLLRTISFELGDTLTRTRLFESIEALYHREIFENVDVKLRVNDGSSVTVEFFLTTSLFIAEINFSGYSALDKKQLRRLSGLQIKDKLSTDALIEAKRRILEGYHREGYFSPIITVDLNERFVAPQVIINFHIDEGRPGRIERVELHGDLPLELGWLPDRAQHRAYGAVASEENIKTFRREILSAVRKEGYLQASADLRNISISPVTGKVSIVAELKLHDPISIVFQGNTVFSADELLAPLKLGTRTVPFTPSAIKNLCKQIERMYQSQGYLYAHVSSERQPRNEKRRIYEVSIEEGRKVRISKLRFEGIEAFSESELTSLMTTRAAGGALLRTWRKGYLQTEALSSDLSLIELHYRDAGYFDAAVSYEILPDTKTDTVELVISVSEGKIYSVKDVQVEWKDISHQGDSDESEILTITSSLKVGEPFSPPAIRVEQKRLADLVIGKGYPNASVDAALNRDTGEVRFLIDPGLKVKVGSVRIAGNTSVADRLIKRELKFASGDTFLPDRLRSSEQSLYGLGYFKAVSITPSDGVLDSDVEDLTVNVAERDTGSIELGTTLSTEDGAHIFGEVGQKNFGGDGETLVLGVDGFVRTGSHILDAGNLRAAFTEPRILGSNLDWYTEGFAQYSIKLLDLYSYDRVGLSTSLRTREEDSLKTSFGFSTYNERVYDVPSDIILGEHDNGATVYSFLSLQLDWDKRDSSFNPRSGHRSLFQTRVNSHVLGSQVDFYAFMLQESLYLPLSPNFVWANNLKSNYLHGFRDTDVIPLSQRISLGGRNSLRGFSLNAVGPRGVDGDIVGGDASITLNSELQYDLTESTVGVLFIDVGQAFLHSKGSFQGDDPDLKDFRYSPGVGLRYRTPIGPITSDLGLNPDREHGERWGRLFVSIGGAF